MPHTDLDQAREVGEKLRRAVADHKFSLGLRVSISLGVGQWALGQESADSLFSRLDDALYRAKQEGRNRVVLAEPPELPEDQGAADHPLAWRAHYASGHDVLDREHREIFADARRIQAQLARLEVSGYWQEGMDELLAGVDQLLTKTRAHFQTEERLLAERLWSGLEAHREQHQILLDKGQALRQAMSAKLLSSLALGTALALGSTSLLAAPAAAKVQGAELAKCLMTKSTKAERGEMVKWVFSVLALNPQLKNMSNVTNAQRDQLNRSSAKLVTSLLTERCEKEAKTVVQANGPAVIQQSFQLLAQMAAKELFADPSMQTGVAAVGQYIDAEKFKVLLPVQVPQLPQ